MWWSQEKLWIVEHSHFVSMSRTVNGKFQPESMMEKPNLTRTFDTWAFFNSSLFFLYIYICPQKPGWKKLSQNTIFTKILCYVERFYIWIPTFFPVTYLSKSRFISSSLEIKRSLGKKQNIEPWAQRQTFQKLINN